MKKEEMVCRNCLCCEPIPNGVESWLCRGLPEPISHRRRLIDNFSMDTHTCGLGVWEEFIGDLKVRRRVVWGDWDSTRIETHMVPEEAVTSATTDQADFNRGVQGYLDRKCGAPSVTVQKGTGDE